MIFYVGFFLLVYFFSRIKPKSDKHDIQLTRALLIGATILLLMGLRDQTVVGDTVTYVYRFQYEKVEWNGFVKFFTENTEPLYKLLEMLCQRVTSSYTVFLFVTSLPVVIGFTMLLKNYSNDMFLSVLMFCGIGSMYFCMAGIRQAIAMGFTMIAFNYAKEKRPIMFLLWCLIAYGFHNSAIVFVFVYFIINWKPNWKMWLIVGVFVILGVTKDPLVIEIANLFTMKQYEMDEVGLNYTLFFIQLVFILFCYLFNIRNNSKEQKVFDSLMVLSFAGLCFQALTPVKGEFFRVSSYFSVYLCMSVPRTLKSIEDRSRKLMYFGMVFGLLAYIFIFGNARSYSTCF